MEDVLLKAKNIRVMCSIFFQLELFDTINQTRMRALLHLLLCRPKNKTRSRDVNILKRQPLSSSRFTYNFLVHYLHFYYYMYFIVLLLLLPQVLFLLLL